MPCQNRYPQDTISQVLIIHNDQRRHQSTISTNNRNNSKINQHLTPFVNWCYWYREVLLEKVCLFVVNKLVLHGKQFLTNRVKYWQIWQGSCVEDAVTRFFYFQFLFVYFPSRRQESMVLSCTLCCYNFSMEFIWQLTDL